jgi:hypothetical protein
MADDMLIKTVSLRDEAFAKLKACAPFLVFKALDDAVHAMGGRRHELSSTERSPLEPSEVADAPVARRTSQRISQADAAEIVLRENGKPMTGLQLMPEISAKGAPVSEKVANLTSTLSRDPRFISVRDNGVYYWWLTRMRLPPRTNEAPDLLREEGSDASSSQSSQEGGEANGRSTTHLTSP